MCVIERKVSALIEDRPICDVVAMTANDGEIRLPLPTPAVSSILNTREGNTEEKKTIYIYI